MAKKSLVKGAAVLAVAGVIVKVLGAFFRIPLANLIGDLGMGYYYPAYNIYGFLLVFATAGIPVAISKMVSERCAVGQFREAERVFKLSRSLMFVIGIIGFFILFFFSNMIADVIHNPESALAMKAMAPALLLVPILSAYRGYFQGMQEMMPTAVSEVVEQFFRVACGLSLAYILMNSAYEMLGQPAEARGAAGGCFGAAAGSLGGLIVMLLVYSISKNKIKSRIRKDLTGERESGRTILKKIAIISIPITIGASAMPLVGLVDTAVITSRLMVAGFDETMATSLLGQLTGFAAPIVQLPLVIIQAIVISLVPMVAAANKRGDKRELHHNISLGLRMATLISIPSAVGMFLLAEPMLRMLYPTQEASAISAASCLQVLSLGFVFLSCITIMTGSLQGIGKQSIPVRNLFIGLFAKIIVTWVLTAIPVFNIKGAAIGTVVTYLVAASLDLMALKKYTKVKLPIDLIIVKPLISACVMGVFVFAGYKALFPLLGSNGTATVFSIFIGIAVYGIMALKTRTILRDEMMTLPMGRKLAVVCDKLHLW